MYADFHLHKIHLLSMYVEEAVVVSGPRNTVHTPPEGWVRAKKICITFDTNFSRYLPRGTIIDGSWKCRMGAFCTIAKISGEMPKKALKTGQNGVKNFLGPHTYWIITFLAFFYFQFFLILVLYRSSILWKLVLKTGSYKYQNEKYWK